jgi:preprotein translocase subunit YajC
MYSLLALLADAQPQMESTAPQWVTFVPLIAIMLFMFLFMGRNSRKQESERQAMVNSMQKGHKVLTNAGIYGTVVSVSDTEDEVVVKVDDNVRLKMIKGSILRNLTREEEAKAAKEKK